MEWEKQEKENVLFVFAEDFLGIDTRQEYKVPGNQGVVQWYLESPMVSKCCEYCTGKLGTSLVASYNHLLKGQQLFQLYFQKII